MSNQTSSLDGGDIDDTVHETPPAHPSNGKDESNYRYAPLDGEDAIRLIIIQPADDTSTPIQCEIIHARLSSLSQPFTALSYVWGDASNTKPIFIQHSKLFIAFNLHDALVNLRNEDECICVWADAISIDQRNLSERNHQVQQMRKIYSRSRETIIYLGNEIGHTAISAWNFLEREWSKKAQPQKYRQLEQMIEFRGRIEDVEHDVLSRPWFKRIWVLQEVVVSQGYIFVQCGSRKVPWDEFCKIILLMPRVNDQYGMSLENRNAVGLAKEMFLARCSFCIANGLEQLLPSWHTSVGDTKSRSTYLLHMLSRARALEASDPRDKIFALLGISTGVDLDDDNIAIDYHKSAVQVFQDFTRYIIENEQTYDIFSYLDQSPKPDTTPTWAPNWQKPMFPARMILNTLESESHETRLLRNAMVKSSHSWLMKDGELVLRCIGSTIGRVTFDLPVSTLRRSHEDQFEAVREVLKGKPQRLNEELLHLWSHTIRLTFWNVTSWQEERDTLKVYNEIWKLYSDLQGAKPQCWTCTGGRQFGIFSPKTPTRKPFFNTLTKRLFCKNVSRRNPPNEVLNQSVKPAESEAEAEFALLPWPLRLTQDKTLSGAALQPWPFILDNQGRPLPNSVEEHLIKRSRRTVKWDRFGGHDSTVLDQTSIVDNRMLIRFQSYVHGDSVAIAPPNVKPSDRIIMLKGARLPFAVRVLKTSDHGDGAVTHEVSLLGECLINGFERYDSVYQGTHSNAAKEEEFTFV
jgi:hypothetical protein